MNALQIIAKKQAGNELSGSEIEYFITNYVSGHIPDYQMAALLMAIYYQEMSTEETYFLTRIMLESGAVLDNSSILQPKADKHSTGGVGDKVSVILAPLVACLGVSVPMISGRALGHSGGTLDKLESIPGFDVRLSVSDAIKKLRKNGLVFMAQTEELVPADRRIYALRDSTSTVRSVPLITASILSKKLAENIDALVLDVKIGKGAFFTRQEYALKLSDRLLAVSEKFGLKTSILFTDMDQPLGRSVGNWLEIKESLETMQGNGPSDLNDVTIALGAEMLVQTRIERHYDKAIRLVEQTLKSGAAYEKFLKVVKSQGGKVKYIERPSQYPTSRLVHGIKSERSGYVSSIDALKIGVLAMDVGAGRIMVNDQIDPKAGVFLNKKVGEYVERGEVLATVHTDMNIDVAALNARIWDAFQIVRRKVTAPDPVLGYAVKDGKCKWPPY